MGNGNSTAGPKKPVIAVKLAKDPDGTLEDPPDGLNVILSVPTSSANALAFEQFVVRPGATLKFLDAVSPPATPTVSATARAPLWCAYSASAITGGTTFGKVAGFGFPLLARFRGNTLVLPNFREVTLRYYNLSGVAHDPTLATDRITADLNAAKSFYNDLHIRLISVQGTVPKANTGPQILTLDTTNGQVIDIEKQGRIPYATPLDLGDASWGLPSDLTHVVLAYWVDELINVGLALGMAITKRHLAGGQMANIGQRFTAAGAASLFVQHKPSPLAVSNALAHEIGHCLLHEPGAGRNTIEGVFNEKAQVIAFLTRLGFEGKPAAQPPGSRLYAKLPQKAHGMSGTNLMGPSGGSTLVDWQAAVFRASKQVGDGP